MNQVTTMDYDLKKRKISEHFARIIEELGLDLDDPSIKDTPERVAKMLVNETCNGLFTEPPIITTFPIDKNTSRDLVVIENIPFNSLCEHHFQPFVGTATIAYLPNDRVMGLSKGARVLDYFASRPQIQERLTNEVAAYLYEQLNAKGVFVIMKAEHFCMKVRGVKKHQSTTITTASLGEIDKKEVLASIQLASSK
ncbi:GTP cyclohydrolase I [Heyndrickxia camelliae]|uniref:GTP cyclohydrolase 1 n=1 Tax=Heyndrickxia camelliae TaxID=1707093 RepID=A0A2N3LM33_9BACI|nr:GTP cyclohydrolase I [Heyndrickxia camelliae]PKR85688.1 GTP cyclohydrolase I FolE [Heyndrickxia camelliae]